MDEITHLRDMYTLARYKYMPHDIRVLFIAEAPPCALDRFFYFEDVKKQDSLFLELMGVLYPEQKRRYLASKRETQRKQELLEQFQADGYWMADLCEIPTSIVEGPSNRDVKNLIDYLNKWITKKTPIILIKTNVYDTCYTPLTDSGYTVIDERMPFPGSGQQGVFREKFRRALSQT